MSVIYDLDPKEYTVYSDVYKEYEVVVEYFDHDSMLFTTDRYDGYTTLGTGTKDTNGSFLKYPVCRNSRSDRPEEFGGLVKSTTNIVSFKINPDLTKLHYYSNWFLIKIKDKTPKVMGILAALGFENHTGFHEAVIRYSRESLRSPKFKGEEEYTLFSKKIEENDNVDDYGDNDDMLVFLPKDECVDYTHIISIEKCWLEISRMMLCYSNYAIADMSDFYLVYVPTAFVDKWKIKDRGVIRHLEEFQSIECDPDFVNIFSSTHDGGRARSFANKVIYDNYIYTDMYVPNADGTYDEHEVIHTSSGTIQEYVRYINSTISQNRVKRVFKGGKFVLVLNSKKKSNIDLEDILSLKMKVSRKYDDICGRLNSDLVVLDENGLDITGHTQIIEC